MLFRSQRPQLPDGYLLEGDVLERGQDFAGAAAVYRRGLAAVQSTQLAVRLQAALLAAKQPAEAEKFAQDWEKKYPDDSGFNFVRGDQAMAQKNWALAEQRFRAVVDKKPRDALALNNLAWLLLKQHKPGALPLAKKANELWPDRPPLLDTLAAALADDKQFDQAVKTQQRAVDMVPDDYTLRLNLARIRIAAGDKATARSELERLQKLGAKLPQQDQVQELLKSLS